MYNFNMNEDSLEYRNLLEMAKGIGDRRRQWYTMFKHYASRLRLPVLTQNDVVVNIGCGYGQDNLSINSALTGRPFGFTGALTLIGIDIDGKAIAEARKLNATGISEYIEGDARQLDTILGDKKPKVIISRDPNIAEAKDAWFGIFEKAYNLSDSGGVVIATARQDFERDLLREGLIKAGYKVEVNEENPFPGKTIEYGGKSGAYDKFVVAGKKTS